MGGGLLALGKRESNIKNTAVIPRSEATWESVSLLRQQWAFVRCEEMRIATTRLRCKFALAKSKIWMLT